MRGSGRGGGGGMSVSLVVTVVACFISAMMSGMMSAMMTKSFVSNKLLLQQSEIPRQILSLCEGKHIGSGAAAAAASSSVATSEKAAVCPPCPACKKCEGEENGAAIAPAESGSSGGEDHPLIELPEGIKNVIINIGTNHNPIMPPEDDPATMVIAVEPILETATKIKKHDRLMVVNTAIASGSCRFQTMQIHNKGGASSSLAAPTNKNAFWVGAKNDGWPSHQIVPVISMKTLIDSIPPSIKIVHLKTDMQGFDFAAVSSAGRGIRRIPEVYAEVYVGTASYVGVKNDLWKDWEPYMKEMGYNRTTNNVKKRGEDNAMWVRIDE